MSKKRKKTANFFIILLISIFFIIAVCNTTCIIKSYVNYKHNVVAWSNYNENGIISEQYKYSDLNYGFGTVAKNGCGAMAVYNILKLENKNPYFPDIINKFDLCGENFFGLGGSKASRVIRVLKNYGLKTTYSLNATNYERIAQNSKYSIYLYFAIQNGNLIGHYQLLTDFDGERYTTINSNGHFTFEEIINIKGTFFSMMIGVN